MQFLDKGNLIPALRSMVTNAWSFESDIETDFMAIMQMKCFLHQDYQLSTLGTCTDATKKEGVRSSLRRS